MDASWGAGLKWRSMGSVCAFPFPDLLHSAEKTDVGLLGLAGENAPLEVASCLFFYLNKPQRKHNSV